MSSLPGTPGAPRSPAAAINGGRSNYFIGTDATSSPATTGKDSATTGGNHSHVRVNSNATVTSGLGMQLYPTSGGKGGFALQHPDAGSGHEDPLAITSPIETTQDFLDWFTKIEHNLESEQELVFNKFKIKIDSFIDDCEEIFECLEDSRGLIKEMEANYKFVEDNSRALQLACEAMLEEQVRVLEPLRALPSDHGRRQ